MNGDDKRDAPDDKKPLDPVFDAEDTNIRRAPKDGELPLPFERDESPGKHEPDANRRREVIEQAGRDIERGLRDTDQHGVPSDVPGPGADPEKSPGADVPPGGVDVENPHGQPRGRK